MSESRPGGTTTASKRSRHRPSTEGTGDRPPGAGSSTRRPDERPLSKGHELIPQASLDRLHAAIARVREQAEALADGDEETGHGPPGPHRRGDVPDRRRDAPARRDGPSPARRPVRSEEAAPPPPNARSAPPAPRTRPDPFTHRSPGGPPAGSTPPSRRLPRWTLAAAGAVAVAVLLVLPNTFALVSIFVPSSSTSVDVSTPTPFPLADGEQGDGTVDGDQNGASVSVDPPKVWKEVVLWGCDPDVDGEAGCELVPSSTDWTNHSEHAFYHEGALDPAPTYWLEAYMKADAGNETSVRLFNGGDDQWVFDSRVNTTSTAWTLVRSAGFTLNATGKEYFFQSRASTANTGAIRMVKLIAAQSYDLDAGTDITKTETQVRISGADASAGGAAVASDRSARFVWNETLFKPTADTKVFFEATGWTDSNGGADIVLHDVTSGNDVTSLNFAQDDPVTRKRVEITGNADWVDGDEYQVELDRGGGGGTLKLYIARIVIQQPVAPVATGRYVDLTWANSTTDTAFTDTGYPGRYHMDTEWGNRTAVFAATLKGSGGQTTVTARLFDNRNGSAVPGSTVEANGNGVTRVQSPYVTLDALNATYSAEYKVNAGDTATVRNAWIVVEQWMGKLYDPVLTTRHNGGACTWEFHLEHVATAGDLNWLDNGTLALGNDTGGKAQVVVDQGALVRTQGPVVTVAPGGTLRHQMRYEPDPANGAPPVELTADLVGKCATNGVHTRQRVIYEFR